ncbi:UNVERIFIED_CONTAM: hypothetical protein H355_001069 [Colinus virginianus]|nr:hypothetical protein H355_001069 [Colinus virginianus]
MMLTFAPLFAGLLKELLKSDHFVSILMNNSKQEEESENSDFLGGENPLPLILKKLLLTRDEMLQAASSHCMAAVLVHSPSRYAPAFIHADVPEFLFECLMCNSEILIWSVYCSLLLLTEERLFFSKCHTVYGIESLVRSLQGVLQLNNVELHKQGLLLFTEILKRQPVEIILFTNRGVCIDAIDVLMKTVDCPVLEVVVEAAKAVAAILRKEHLSSPPVPYEKLQKLLEAVLKQCVDLSPPHSSNKHASEKCSSLLWYLLCTYRLAVELQSDPMAQENAFTAPCSESKETLNNFSEFLLRICDSVCIPMVMGYLERAVSSSVMEVFISALNTLFTVVPNMRNKFSKKLASSCFIRLTLELKARFCSVQSLFAITNTASYSSYTLPIPLETGEPRAYQASGCVAITYKNQWRSLCIIKRILDSLPDLSLVYVHCPLLLKFFLHYPELMGRFGHQVLQLWFSWEDCNHLESEEAVFGTSDQLNSSNPLLPILKSNSSILLILLDLVRSSSVLVAQKVLITLRTFLERNEDVFVCDLLRNQFLQILQQLLVESSSASLQANRNLPILLNLLFLVQLRSKGMRELDSTDFKLLHQALGSLQLPMLSRQNQSLVINSGFRLPGLVAEVQPSLVMAIAIFLHFILFQVHQTLSLDLRQVLNAVILRNKKPVLLLVSIVQFLRAIMRQNFSSSLKDLLLSQAVVACLETLLEYLFVKNQDVALHVASQPWHRFLLLTLLNGSQKSILQPEILRLMTLFLKYQSSNIISQKEIGQILQEVAEANLLELPETTSRALHLFLCQVRKQ